MLPETVAAPDEGFTINEKDHQHGRRRDSKNSGVQKKASDTAVPRM